VDQGRAFPLFRGSQAVWEGVEESAGACEDKNLNISTLTCLEIFQQAGQAQLELGEVLGRHGSGQLGAALHHV